MFLQLLAAMLRELPSVDIVATAASVEEARAALADTAVDLLVLDLCLPDGDGVDLLREAVAKQPELRCVVLSSGARDFVCPDDLAHVVHAVVDKANAYEQLRAAVESLVPTEALPAGPDPREVLTDRELEVFRLIGRGRFSKEIAAELCISQLTVATHRKRIGQKLGASGMLLARVAIAYQRRTLD